MLKSVSECTEPMLIQIEEAAARPWRDTANFALGWMAPHPVVQAVPLTALGPLQAQSLPSLWALTAVYYTVNGIYRQQFMFLWFTLPPFLLHLCVTLFQPRVVPLLELCTKPSFPSSPPCSAVPLLPTAGQRTWRFNSTPPSVTKHKFSWNWKQKCIICWYLLDRKAWQT